jgi:rfaE bifunctional protein nucleotidyltransferase chain/domain
MTTKFYDLDDLAKIKHRDAIKVLCHGCWDILHVGHVRHLQAASTWGEILIVTVTADEFVGPRGPGRPIFDAATRAEVIAALECVDYVAINHHPTAVEAIRLLCPHLYIKGIEFEDNITPELQREADEIKSVGGQLRFAGQKLSSSTMLAEMLFGRRIA